MSVSPQQFIADLDASLANREVVRLVRRTGSVISYSVDCPARVRDYRPDELIGNIDQGTSEVVISSTQIIEKGWPGPATTSAAGDRRVPVKGDLCIIQQRPRNIQAAVPVYIQGELVRINLQVEG